MSKKKKHNPYHRPVCIADVKKARVEAVENTWAIFFTVMRDKEGWGPKRLQRLWNEIGELSDSISKGYVSVGDLRRALEDESGIILS